MAQQIPMRAFESEAGMKHLCTTCQYKWRSENQIIIILLSGSVRDLWFKCQCSWPISWRSSKAKHTGKHV